MNDISTDPKRGPGRPPKYREAIAANVQPETAVEGAADTPATRPVRKPFGALEQKLNYPSRPGFHRHWFNDQPGRVQRAQEAGYDHVKGDDGKNVSRIVGTAEGGGPLHGYLMEIPEEWYKADMAAQQQVVNDKEMAMRRGELEKGEKSYVPAQGIKIGSV